MTRVEELMLVMNVDRMTAEFYEALETGESTGDLIVIDEDGNEVKPDDAQ